MNTPSFMGSGGPEGAFTEELLLQDARLGDNLIPITDDVPSRWPISPSPSPWRNTASTGPR